MSIKTNNKIQITNNSTQKITNRIISSPKDKQDQLPNSKTKNNVINTTQTSISQNKNNILKKQQKQLKKQKNSTQIKTDTKNIKKQQIQKQKNINEKNKKLHSAKQQNIKKKQDYSKIQKNIENNNQINEQKLITKQDKLDQNKQYKEIIKKNVEKIQQINISPRITNKSEQIDNIYKNNNDNKKDYLQILLKYKKLAGKQIKPNKVKNSQNVQKVKEDQHYSLQHTENKLKVTQKQQIKIQNIKRRQKTQEKLEKQQQISNHRISGYPISLSAKNQGQKLQSTSRIKFLAQKQHSIQDIKNNFANQKGLNLNQVRNKIQALTNLKKSSSLPTIPQNQTQYLKKNIKIDKNQSKIDSGSPVVVKQQKIKNDNQRKDKERQLNSVGFMLTNLKQKINQNDKKLGLQNTNTSRILSSKNNNSTKITKSFYSQISPRKTNTKMNLIQLTNSPITSNKQSPDRKANKQQFEVKNIQQNKTQQITISPKQKLKVSPISLVKQKNQQNTEVNISQQKISKLAQKQTRLEQIKEDIEDQNHEKQELINQRRKMNKNLQISMLQKRERIAQLEAQINHFEVIDQNNKIQASDIKQKSNNTLYITQLQQQKDNKQKNYKKEKEKLKDQISKMEQKILQQEKKYSTLKQTQITMKNQELLQKQQQLQQKNKKMAMDLENKTKQLQEIIKKQQQKSKLFKLQLEQQTKKNQMISKQLKKQEQLEQLLLTKLQKITQQRQIHIQKKNQEKAKQKLKLIQQIKKLQQTQNKILLEYQRDSQAATSMFQAIRLKNIQLENQIRKKQKKSQTQDSNTRLSSDLFKPQVISS